MTQPIPVPLQNVVMGPDGTRLSKPYVDFLTTVAGAIGAYQTPPLPSGRYRLSWYVRVVTAAGTSSRVAVTAAWVDGGVSCTLTGDALTSNATNVPATAVWLLAIDADTAVTMTTAYGSVGSPAMAYQLSFVLEVLP